MSEFGPLGLEPSSGYYVWRATKGAPRQGVRIIHNDDGWHVLVSGTPERGSGASDWLDVPFLCWNWPLHPISAEKYEELLAAFQSADRSHPLSAPGEPIDLRHTRSLF